MATIELLDGMRIQGAVVDPSRPQWVGAKVQGESTQYIPTRNVQRILSDDGEEVTLPRVEGSE